MSWIEIARTTSPLEASIWKMQLEDLEVEFKEFSNIDSAYTNLGDIRIFVKEADAIKAKNKLNSHYE